MPPAGEGRGKMRKLSWKILVNEQDLHVRQRMIINFWEGELEPAPADEWYFIMRALNLNISIFKSGTPSMSGEEKIHLQFSMEQTLYPGMCKVPPRETYPLMPYHNRNGNNGPDQRAD